MKTTVEEYADRIMIMITEDATEDEALRASRSFTDLHDHVDANEYMIHANVPFNPENLTVMAFYVNVQDEVSRRLEDGSWADDDQVASPRERALAHGTVLGQFEPHDPGCDFMEGRSTTCTC